MAGKYLKYRAKRQTVSKKMRKVARRSLIKYRRGRTVPQRTSVNVGKGFPKRITMTHKYEEFLDLTATLGAFTKYQFSTNSLYDPNETGTGHQPLYFDQMAPLYDHYTVIGSKITVVFTPTVANTAGFFFGGYIDDDTSTGNITGISVMGEQTQGKSYQVAPGSQDTKRFVMKWSAKKNQAAGSVLANNSLQGTVSAGPSEQSFYTLGIQGFTNSADVSAKVTVKIEYIAVWHELKEVAGS